MMNRKELIELVTRRMSKHRHLTQQDIYSAVKVLIEQMSETLTNDDRIEIRGFGSFSLHHHNARKSRNPKTGEAIHMIAKSRVHFKPGLAMRDKVNAAMLKEKKSAKRSKQDAVTQRLLRR